jgi:O-antigen/teichoic acid export membrane protein
VQSEFMKTSFNEAATSPPITSPEAATRVLDVEFGSTLGQISRHSAVFFAGTMFTMAAGYLVKIYVARVLGAEQLGVYALGMTLVSLTQLFGTLGLQGTAARYVSVFSATGNLNELRGFLTRSVGIVVSLNIVLSLGLIFCGHWVSQNLYHAPDLARYIPLFAGLAVLGALNVFYCQVLAGLKEITKRTVITNFVGSPLVIALTVLLLALGTGMWGYLAAQIINNVIVVTLLVALAWKLTPARARFSFSALPPLDSEIKSFTAAVFGMNVVDFLSTQADKILLGLYLNARVLGIYVLASTLSAFIPIILQSVNQIFAPVIADLHAQGRQDVLEKLFQTLTKWILGLTLPLGFVMIIFALPLMRLFGPDFAVGWPVLVIGAVGQLVNCGVGSVGYLLLMSGNQRKLVKVQFAMAGVSILLNVALIPVLGIVGAASAAAFVNAAGNLWNLYEVRMALRIYPYNRSYYALLIPTVFAVVAVALLRLWTASIVHQWLAILLALVLSYAVFGGLAIAYVLDSDDRMLARSAWSRLRGVQKKEVSA